MPEASGDDSSAAAALSPGRGCCSTATGAIGSPTAPSCCASQLIALRVCPEILARGEGARRAMHKPRRCMEVAGFVNKTRLAASVGQPSKTEEARSWHKRAAFVTQCRQDNCSSNSAPASHWHGAPPKRARR